MLFLIEYIKLSMKCARVETPHFVVQKPEVKEASRTAYTSHTRKGGDTVKQVRFVIPWIGSDSDLSQAHAGLKWLHDEVIGGRVTVPMVVTSSIHRNGDKVIYRLNQIAAGFQPCDVLVMAAGMANHLAGTADAWLRYVLRNTSVKVIGVAFEGRTQESTLAAQLSISQVPGTQVVYGDDQGPFVGSEGFLRACQFAVNGELPVIGLPMPRPEFVRTLAQAVSAAAGQGGETA